MYKNHKFLRFLGASSRNGEVSLRGIFNPIDPEYIVACHFLHVSFLFVPKRPRVYSLNLPLVPFLFLSISFLIDLYIYLSFFHFIFLSFFLYFRSMCVAQLRSRLSRIIMPSFVCLTFSSSSREIILSIFLNNRRIPFCSKSQGAREFHCCTFCTFLHFFPSTKSVPFIRYKRGHII